MAGDDSVAGWLYVRVLLFHKHSSLCSMKFSNVLPLLLFCAFTHIVLWAFISPIRKEAGLLIGPVHFHQVDSLMEYIY